MPLLLVVGAFTLLALLFTGQVWLDFGYARTPVSWPVALAISAVDWYAWAPFTPVVLWLSRRFPFGRRTWTHAAAVHLPASLVVTVIKIVASAFIADRVCRLPSAPTSFLKAYMALLTYWAIVAVGAAARSYRDRRERDVQTSRLETELARAQLDALKMRLHPHFLFNTLNSISALMREDVEAADVMITRLSDLLRLTLDSAQVQEVPVQEELTFLEKYLEIQQVRFGDRLTVRIEMDPGTLALAVPSLVLQPLVENALQHGAGRRTGPATVVVRSWCRGTTLVIEVEDDGPGPAAVVREGHGMDTTRARLSNLYGAEASLTLERAAAGGAVARLTLPARTPR